MYRRLDIFLMLATWQPAHINDWIANGANSYQFQSSYEDPKSIAWVRRGPLPGIWGVPEGAWSENRRLYDNSKSSIHIETRVRETFRTWMVHWRQRYALIGHLQIRYGHRNKHGNSDQQRLPLGADNNNNNHHHHHHSVVSLTPGP